MKSIIKIIPGKSISRFACELPDGASSIGYSQKEKAVAVCSYDDGSVGFVGADGLWKMVPRRIEIPHPAGMSCDMWGIILFQLLPNVLWAFDQSFSSGLQRCGMKTYQDMSRLFKPGSEEKVPYGICRSEKERILIAMPLAHTIISVKNGQFNEQIGSGKRGLATSSSPRTTMFNSPSGVCYDNGLIFVSDSGNGIIRVFAGMSERPSIGRPGVGKSVDGRGHLAGFAFPSQIKANRNFVAVVDGNLIRTFRTDSPDVSTPYASSHKILDVALGGDAIYVLEAI
jgi:hypothetical protein